VQKYITLFDPKKAVNVNVRELGNTCFCLKVEASQVTTTGIVLTPPERSPTKE
jgi:hypothetical protein